MRESKMLRPAVRFGDVSKGVFNPSTTGGWLFLQFEIIEFMASWQIKMVNKATN